ncbi:MAG: DinB family protein [Thermoanaerobaculaceae bacterium]
MADLLECLLQLKALADTPGRFAELAPRVERSRWYRRPAWGVWAPVEVLAHLADAELFHGTRVRLVLTSERPAFTPYDQTALAARAGYLAWPVEVALERFTVRRRDNLELLESCDASELGRVGLHPVRGEMTIADIVALLLAHDIDHLGQVRQRLGLATPPADDPTGDTA